MEVVKNWSKAFSKCSIEELFFGKLTQRFRAGTEKVRLVELHLKECRKPKSKI